MEKAGTYYVTTSVDGCESIPSIVENVAMIEQSITFIQSDVITNVNTITLAATVDTGLSLDLSTSSENITLNSNVATIIGAGKVTIIAKQPGNALFQPAVRSVTFCINPAKPVIKITESTGPAVRLESSSPVGNRWYKDGQPMTEVTSPQCN